jgi:hypothetical protein
MSREVSVMCAMFAFFIHSGEVHDTRFTLEGIGERAQLE